MAEQTQEAVTQETEAEQTPQTEENKGETGPDVLDQLLNEFNAEDAQSEQKPETKQDQAQTQGSGLTPQEVAAFRQQQFDSEVNQAVDMTLEAAEELKAFPREWIRGRLEAEASRDNRFRQAWVARHRNPQAFQQIVQGLGKRFAAELPKIASSENGKDIAAAQAAVRGVSSEVPPAPSVDNKELSKMNQHQFEEFKRNL